MDVLSQKEMAAREEEAFRSGLSAAALMEAAGEAMAWRIIEIYPKARYFLVLVGKGNNGGDGLVVARHLSETRRTVQIILTSPEEQLGKLPRAQLDILRGPFPNLRIRTWHDGFEFPDSDGVVIDALLGLNAKGALRGAMAGAVAKLNAARADRFFRTVSLDLPSGLAGLTDDVAPGDRDAAVVADVTIAVGFAKDMLCREALSRWVGRLEVVSWSKEATIATPRQTLHGPELAGLLPRRNALSHKNTFGQLAIVAGSSGFTGAPVLCAQAAQAMGAGLLSIVTHADVSPIVAAQAPPEVMVSTWKSSDAGVLQRASAIVIGPGLGVKEPSTSMLRSVLAAGCPVVIDADGLTLLAKNLKFLHGVRGPILLPPVAKNLKLLHSTRGSIVLTPHPGEMAHLIGRKFGVDEREAVAREFTDKHDVTLVLKGTRTLITARGQPLFINTTGNPGLSTGGSGDTLSGIIGALLAQGLMPLHAACLGVWIHGHAADLVLAERGCEEGMTPTMLSAYLGAALVSLRAQAVLPDGLLECAKNFAELGFPSSSPAFAHPRPQMSADTPRCPV